MSVLNRARRTLLAAVLATTVLALAGSSAGAIQLSLGEGTFRSVWTPMRFNIPGLAISCNMTIEGSFHRTTIAKVERSLIGYVTRAAIESCSSGSMRLLTETLPWHLQYGSFSGALPNISSVATRLIGMGASLTISSITCLARSEENTPALLVANRSGGVISSLRWDETAQIPLTGTSCGIFGRANLSGTSSAVTGLGNTRAISLSLIGEGPSLSPSPVEFGRAAPEEVVTRSVTIRAGTASLEVRSIGVRSGANFTTLDPNRCVGRTLPEGGTCAIRAIFAAPSETGRSFEDTLSVGTNAGTLVDTLRAST